MQCDRCGETMRPETVIQLRRSFGRVRATHRPGCYCTNCGASSAIEAGGPPAAQASHAPWLRHAVRAMTPTCREWADIGSR